MSMSISSVTASSASSKGWNITLWILQILLAGMFGMAGFMKLTMPIAQLSVNIPWAAVVPPALVRIIGLSEFAGALGLILPSLTRIRPQLTVLAAAGLVLVMILAMIFHLVRGEVNVIGINVLLGAPAALIAWGRSRKAPIAPRS